MQLFYIPEVSDDFVTLNQTESKHAIKVLRLSTGDLVQIVDGKGSYYEAKILNDNPKSCQLSVLKSVKDFGKKDFRLHMAVAPTKNIDRFEWFLEKATEIGIDDITPLLCKHSERKVIKPDRLGKILISAMKQSLKAYLPQLDKLTSFKDLISKTTGEHKFIAHCYDGEKPHLKDVIKAHSNVLVLVGPEGDFSLEEVKLAAANGFTEVSLGNARLRTETAGVVACHIVNLVNE